MPVTGRIPFTFQFVDKIPVFILAAFAEPIGTSDGMIVIIARFRAEFGVYTTLFTFLSTAGALKDFLNRQDLSFPNQRIPFILRQLKFGVQRDDFCHCCFNVPVFGNRYASCIVCSFYTTRLHPLSMRTRCEKVREKQGHLSIDFE